MVDSVWADLLPFSLNLAMALASNYFVGIYARGPKWLLGKSIHEQPLEAHFAYMEKLQSSNVLILGGPFKDDEGALAIIEATDLAEAQLVFDADPGVIQEIFSVVVHPWFATVAGEVGQRPW